jgi:hypothetical protein
MNDPHPADLAEPALGGIAGVCGALPHGEVVANLSRLWRPHAGGWEAISDAKGGGGLFAAFEAVADKDAEGLGSGCWK